MRKADREPTAFGWFVMAKMAEHQPPLSQSELARRTGVSQSTISRWIYDPGLPEAGSLRKLADAIGEEDADELYAELMARAGYGRPADEVSDTAEWDSLAWEINMLIRGNSPMPADQREGLRAVLRTVVEPYRRYLRARRTA